MLEVTAKPEELTNVEHLYMDVESRDKATLLRRISHIKDMRGLVFVKDKPRMEILLEKLHYDKVKAAGIHGEIRKEKRKNIWTTLKRHVDLFNRDRCSGSWAGYRRFTLRDSLRLSSK